MTVDDYNREFVAERNVDYPAIDEFERSLGFAIERSRLEHVARSLACPLKRNRACWQHGRVVYAMARRVIAGWLEKHNRGEVVNMLDIGTAKGFSALMMQFAIDDSDAGPDYFRVVSLDVIDPVGRIVRNTVAELGGLLTLDETLAAWREHAKRIVFLKTQATDWLAHHNGRIHFAFIDGKHTYDSVQREFAHLARLQKSGDALVADDVHIEGVAKALNEYRHAYTWQIVNASPTVTPEEIARPHAPRSYAIAVRR